MQRSLDQMLEDIYDAPEGAEIVAMFDFDKTLIEGYSAKSFLTEQLREGQLSPRDIRNQASAVMKFQSGRANFSAFMAQTAETFRGQAEYKFEEFGDRVYKKKVAGAIYPEARQLLQAHKDMGHTISIVSSATKYQIEPAARELGIEYILCTDLEIVDGIFTGEVISPTCFGDGKRYAGEDFCEAFDADISEAFFYTDSEDDLPLLEVVGHPRVVNPSKKLAGIAKTRSYPVCNFKSGGRPTLREVARTAGIYAMLPTSLAMTAPLWAITGDKRKALNAGLSMWTDFATALAGLDIEVIGEEHLWSHRPCVFIFNHQSSADTIIVGNILRKDVTAIGKKEIQRFPVVGAALTYADVVFIDRGSSSKAIDQIKPVITALKEEKLSVVLSPEGTRSRGRTLGKFKKGAFHIAMQAGVPIVPIVVHNAADALPKGQNIVRSAKIKVTVLPPVKTSRWTLKTLDQNIARVRDMYLDTLGQADDLAAE